MRTLIILATLLLSIGAFAHDGHHHDEDLHPSLRKPNVKYNEKENPWRNNRSALEPLHVKLNVICISSVWELLNTGWEPDFAPNYLDPAIANLDQIFAPANIHFEVCDVKWIYDEGLFTKEYSAGVDDPLYEPYEEDYCINVFVMQDINGTNGTTGGGIGGFSGYNLRVNGGFDNNCIFLTRSSLTRYTLVHEMGHFFGLYHTFEGYDDPSTAELVDGSNCTTHGDEICDTPADPMIRDVTGWFNGVCQYYGTATDANGDSYNPDINNAMAYTECPRTNLTQGQIDLINYYVRTEQNRSYLFFTEEYCDFNTASVNNNYIDSYWWESLPIYNEYDHNNPNDPKRLNSFGFYVATIVEANCDLHFQAKEEVIFEPGFEAKNGSELLANIGFNCDDFYNGNGAVQDPVGGRSSEAHLSEFHQELQKSKHNQESPLRRLNEAYNVYPNPSKDYVNIDANFTIKKVQLYDQTGKIVFSYESQNEIKQINTSNMANGFYIMKINDNHTERIAVQH